ncbi:MAG TPA: hypothetical protein VE844_00235, partial [Gammaproteobacteria bacterium]|nr:hypothetical protein [Gammaproteobacteria bacterium]
MRLPTYAIGIDSSTTATKAVVWDQDGRSVAEGRCAFPLTKPRPGWQRTRVLHQRIGGVPVCGGGKGRHDRER